MCVYELTHLLSPLILLQDGSQLVGQIAVLLAQFVVAVAVLLDLGLDVQHRALELAVDLRSLSLVLLALQ